MKIVTALMALITALGPKLKDAWPHLEVIFAELQKIYVIMNNGKSPMFGDNVRMKSPDGSALAKLIKSKMKDDVDSADIKKGVAIAELLDGRIS